MSSDVWVVFPTANEERCSRAIATWAARGYHVAVMAEWALKGSVRLRPDFLAVAPRYLGYWVSVNDLSAAAFQWGASVVVAAADDMTPDPKKPASVIAAEYLARFPDGEGIMQPTGDDLDGTDRICGSPWFGRKWASLRGPCHAGYWQFYGDEETKLVAERDGLLWQRKDLCQRHDHWTRKGAPCKTDYQQRNSDQFWAKDKRLFEARQAKGFPA